MSVLMKKAKNKKPYIIVVTGGVLSGLGKGVACASIGNILKSRGFRVNIQKFDPYLNSDSGTLNPAEHGEVFVTEDGGETDLDLGHYERFLDENVTRQSSIMAGRIYFNVIEQERSGAYLGKTVQIIPHVTNMIKEHLWKAATSDSYDVHIVEIGGTVGDYEGVVFHEAMRQLRLDVGDDHVLYVHLVFLPYLGASGEVKTKPAQSSVRDLRSIGIQPDVLLVRSDHEFPKGIVEKLALFTNVPKEAVIQVPTMSEVYEVPPILEKQRLHKLILDHFSLRDKDSRNKEWSTLIKKIKRNKKSVRIALVGKYMDMGDTYMSLTEALKAAAWSESRNVDIWWVDAEDIESGRFNISELKNADGVIVPGGFGKRGTEGKIAAIKYARENDIPYFGLCLGMQLAVVEYARNVAGISDAISEEFGKIRKGSHVIHIMEDQKFVLKKGGTMRLGGWKCRLYPRTISRKAYNKAEISERHRHRYEFNTKFREHLEKCGLVIAGTSPDRKLVEIVELKEHPFFVGVQFHPEFKSRPIRAHPLFRAFIQATKIRGSA